MLKTESFIYVNKSLMIENYKLNLSNLRERLSEKEGNAYFIEFNKKHNLNHIIDVIIIGDNSSWNVCLIGKYMIEEYTQLYTSVVHISDLDTQKISYKKNTLIIICGISQSFMELKTVLENLKADGILTLSISDSIEINSDIAISTDLILETGISKNHMIIPQVIILSLITLNIGRHKTISLIEGREIIANLYSLPNKIDFIFEQISMIVQISDMLRNSHNISFWGNRYNYAIAKEGAFLFSTKCGIHSSAVYASEMKHGAITLVDEGMPFVIILCEDKLLTKTISNIEELKARRAKIVLITNLNEDYLTKIVDYLIKIPSGAELYTPILAFKVIELLAHFTQKIIY